MRRRKILTLSIMIIGAISGCSGKEAASNETEVIDTTVSEEPTSVEEVSAVEETTTIEETEVPKTETVEDVIDDITYNTELIMTFDIRKEDAEKVAEFLDRISYGKIDASRRVEKGGETRFEITNKDGVIYYLVRNEDTVREIINVKGEFIVSITTSSTPNVASNSSGIVEAEQEEIDTRVWELDMNEPDYDDSSAIFGPESADLKWDY